MAARWYNPAAGQFTSRDTVTLNPVPDSVHANRYAYVDDNPLTGADPTGHCSWWDVVCGTKAAVSTVSNSVSSAWNSASSYVSSAWNSASSYASAVWDDVKAGASWAYHQTTNVVNKVTNYVKHKVNDGANWVKRQTKRATAAVRKASSWVNHKVTHYASVATHAVSTAYHAAANAATSAGNWVKNHAADIAGFVAGGAAFLGCEAALGAISFGAGAIAGAAICGAVAGAVGGLVTQGVRCGQGKEKDACSGKAFLTAGVVGGVGGAIGGGIAGAIGGKIASSLLGDGASSLLSRVGAGALDGAVTGAISGAAAGGGGAAVDYGINCGDHCSLGGLGNATASGAASGAIMGAAFGVVGGGVGGLKGSKGGGCHSFDPATPVLMADGSTKPIKDVNLGDKVTSTDPATGTTDPQPVVALHDNHDNDLADVTIQHTDGHQDTLHTTWHHPFWNTDTHTWTDADHLTPGTHLHTTNTDTDRVTVVAVHTWTSEHDMRDLTLATIHTYYVIAGTTPVLVHNCGTADPNELRFSQNTAGGRGRADSLRQSMSERGWDGDAVDVVRTPDGLTTIDNTRVAVAQELGLPEIPVNIRTPDEPLPANMLGRFGSAETWGDALIYRTSRQRPPLGPTGTDTRPRMP